MSTRNTKPSSVGCDSSWIIRRTIFSAAWGCGPWSRMTNTRSTSEETFSSQPPSLPMPTTSRSCAIPSLSTSSLPPATNSCAATRRACVIDNSASLVVARQISATGACWLTSRSIIASMTRLRNRRSAASGASPAARRRCQRSASTCGVIGLAMSSVNCASEPSSRARRAASARRKKPECSCAANGSPWSESICSLDAMS